MESKIEELEEMGFHIEDLNARIRELENTVRILGIRKLTKENWEQLINISGHQAMKANAINEEEIIDE